MMRSIFCLKRFAYFALVILVIIPVSAHTKKMKRIPTGVWGGQSIHIDVDASSSTVEFDCAHGTIDEPFMIDSKGQFSVKGTYARQHGGPVRIDEKNSNAAATYYGTVKGQSMTLKIKLANEGQTAETFVLTKGNSGKLRKCL